MGMIKLPEQSVSFFEDHYSEIFESGNLAEGKWISEVASWATGYTNAPFAHAVNSNGAGIFSILNIHYLSLKVTPRYKSISITCYYDGFIISKCSSCCMELKKSIRSFRLEKILLDLEIWKQYQILIFIFIYVMKLL